MGYLRMSVFGGGTSLNWGGGLISMFEVLRGVLCWGSRMSWGKRINRGEEVRKGAGSQIP